jgi:hypothetical protein
VLCSEFLFLNQTNIKEVFCPEWLHVTIVVQVTYCSSIDSTDLSGEAIKLL